MANAKNGQLKRKFKQNKEGKHVVRFGEDVDDGDKELTGSIYLPKDKYGQTQEITVTVDTK